MMRRALPVTLCLLAVGCVSLSAQFFPDGAITEKRLKRPRTAVQLELEPVVSRFRSTEWDCAIGASGTLRSIAEVLQAHGTPAGTITREGLAWLVQQCLAAGSLEKLRPEGLPQERYDVFPGGLAIIAEIFAMLGVERMTVADGALREGLLHDLLGRFTDEDARARCVVLLFAGMPISVLVMLSVARKTLARIRAEAEKEKNTESSS